MIAYTSGSTGLPKGAIYPHDKFLRTILYTAMNEGLVHDSVWLQAMPAAGVPMMHSQNEAIRSINDQWDSFYNAMLNKEVHDLFWSYVRSEEPFTILRRIFAEYVDGCSPLAIVERLNREGVRGPRGGAWNASTLNGSRQRENGILSNSLYVGRLTSNRQRFIKDPANGRR